MCSSPYLRRFSCAGTPARTLGQEHFGTVRRTLTFKLWEGVRYWLVKYDSAKKEILTPHEPPVVSCLDLIVLRSQLKQNTPGLREGFLVNTLRFSTAIVTLMHHNSMKMKVTL